MTPLAHSKFFRECWALWPQHHQCYSWACSACAPPPSTLVETTGSTQRMASRTLAYQGESGLCNSPDPLEEPTVDGEGRGHGVGPHQESCHDRRLQHRLGGAVRRQTDLRPLVEDGERLPHQLLGNASSLSSLPVFPAGPNRTPCADSLRQHVRGVLYKSPGRCLLEAPLYSGRAPSGMGSAQPALAEGSTPARQTEPRSGYVISEQCPLRGVDAPLRQGRRQGRSRPFRLQRQLSLPNLLFEGQGRVGPRLAQTRWPTIWHPRPELWALYVWPLNGSLLASQSEC